MRIILGTIMIAAAVVAPACWGQGLFDQVNFRNPELSGFGVYGLSAYYGYTSYGQTTNSQTHSNSNYGVSFSAGWQHHRTKANSSILYSGTYGGLVQYPQFNGYSQALSFNVNQKIASKWTGTVSASGQDYSLAQSLFQPASLSVTSQMVSSFNDFAAAFGIGQFSTSQVQSLYQSAFQDSAVRSGLLGGRVLSYAGQASLSYGYSPHLSVTFTGFASGGRHLGGSGDTTVQPNYAMPQSEGGTAGISYTHGFSPRTQVGIDLGDSYIRNFYQDASISTATASFGRKMGRQWFLRIYGGGSYTHFLEKSLALGHTIQGVGGGSIAFRMLTNTLAAAYDRSASNGYGFSIGTNTSLTASWNWHRPGSRLSVFSSFGQEQQRNAVFLSISGWQASAGISENLGTQTAVSMQYVYLDSTARYPASDYRIKTNSVRASLSWSPRPLVR